MAFSQAGSGKGLLSRLEPFFKCSSFRSRSRAQSTSATGHVNFSKWRKLDSRKFGIARSHISLSSQIVLKKLHSAGFEAYLVGGCVRDFLLNKVPKDFDVITTASLKKVKTTFRSAIIIGRRFPICRVTVKGFVVEVSSFETRHEQSCRKQVHVSNFPIGCDKKDLARWNNCLQRDFTINSLYYDPYSNTIFDYADAMTDLKSLTLRTVIPAHLSFKDDQARILRGLRLAARLDLSFSRETEVAICNLSSSVAGLSMSRIHLEMNYMLSYGAAEPSLLLLKRFNLLEILLPFNAAYLSEQAKNGRRLRSSMLMKLFFNLDRLITCDRPCDECLWVALLAFHLALFNNPQNAVVALTLASLFSHGTWEESVNFARKHAPVSRIYVPEIVAGFDFLSDDEVAERVTNFSVQMKESVDVFTSMDCLLKSMAKFPEFSCSGLVSVPRKMGLRSKDVFDILLEDVRSLTVYKKGTDIDYSLLKAGDINEIRFVLGKIIINTLVCGAVEHITEVGEDVVPSIDPLQNLEVFEEIRVKDTQSMIESNYKLLPHNDSKVSLVGKNVFIEDKLSGRSKMIVTTQLNVLLQNKQDLSKTNRQEVTNKCQKLTSESKGHLLQDYMSKDDGKSKTFQLPDNTISGKYKANPTTQKNVNNGEYNQSSQKHFNVSAEFLPEVMKMVPMYKEKDQRRGIYKQRRTANECGNSDVSNQNSSLDKTDEDKQVKAKVPRAVGTLLSSLFK
ncbi:uncharacterized protein LOC142547258 isoform X1 [Primulina tabacum]|uniref:uncharacterized protein LOC142547258 isoform X1 n=1 Tax=Primulina tabacum TaxID=48773 RepID=UPI003F59B5C4